VLALDGKWHYRGHVIGYCRRCGQARHLEEYFLRKPIFGRATGRTAFHRLAAFLSSWRLLWHLVTSNSSAWTEIHGSQLLTSSAVPSFPSGPAESKSYSLVALVDGQR